jgi:choline monooxygenase
MEGYSPADIVQTEMEDEAVVQSVQQGIQSRLYKSGRYAPQWEAGVKQFHDILRSKLGT